ncbi:hypothetical protein EPUS_03251 [Endocarpon pusillum Z07020]|uniref:Translation initiation factor IF-2, mitochondrial n=1 Tax=Endocarpon pusillum (strain Z07020 / HMAS-L-300199) TaxID=1263415 RepID=U1GBE2_ENDPU|nr:uncharacterized protein EPUS_03251 [Endocarpon pusillum Z07020]ERF74867.1 hypothetical protein EPUS_03251 [Endocarpon pusillum Z07020]
MPGKITSRVAPRQDLCIFCALRLGRASQFLRPHPINQKRPYRASSQISQPPAAAYAIAQEDPDESPQSVQQPSPPPLKQSQGAWPVFVPRKPIAKAIEPVTRPPEVNSAPSAYTNWKCSGCGNSNLARRDVCVSCRTPKHKPPRRPQPGLSSDALLGDVQRSLPRLDELLNRRKSSPQESRVGGQRYPPLSFGTSNPVSVRDLESRDQTQQSQLHQVNSIDRSGGSTRENVTRARNAKQPFDFGRSISKTQPHINPPEPVPKLPSKWGHSLGRSEGSTREQLGQGGQKQQALDFGRSSSEADGERPVWRFKAFNGPGSVSSRQDENLPDRAQPTSRISLRQGGDQPGRDPNRRNQRPSFEEDMPRVRFAFSKAKNNEQRASGPTAGEGAPFIPAEQPTRIATTVVGGPVSSISAVHPPKAPPVQATPVRARPISIVDTGDRSGINALLGHVADTRKPQSRLSRSTDVDITFGQEARAPIPETLDMVDNVIPKFSMAVTDSLYNESEEAEIRNRKQRQKSRLQKDEEEGRRTRGRFQVDAEEPEVAPSKLEPHLERKGARRASSRPNSYDMLDHDEELLSGERDRKKKKAKGKGKAVISARTPIQLPEFISVKNLATALRLKTEDFINRMEEMGFERPRHDHVLDAETSGLIASEFNFEPIYAQEVQDLVPRPMPEDVSSLPQRPPIVTIMGHVDHGKTTILDWLRKSSVVESEHGGITQHIGAFSVTMPGGKQITFLDTPGHAAFLEMRRRGANVTDIVILVVAADDSVKPQTVEAIKHATDAKVPIIVAINKVDKADANVDRVKQDLARHGVTVEDYGGDVQAVPVSGKFGKGMAELEEATVTLSELLDHRAEVDGPVEGWIIESKVTLAGRVATVLVRRGTLRAGNIIVAGTTWARVRTLRNDAGALVNEAPPGTPVQIDGWRADDPIAGWQVLQTEDEDHAKEVVELRRERDEYTKLAGDTSAINAIRSEEAEARATQLAWEAEQQWASKRAKYRPNDNAGWVEGKTSSGPKQVHFVVKADVSGSVEALVNSISAIGNNEIAANVIRSGVGAVNESDVNHLASSGEVGYLISFNQPVDASVSRLAEAAGLEILDHNIIYKVTDVVKEKLTAELPPAITQRVVGEAEIAKVFEISVKKAKVKVAGCKISNGVIRRDKKIRVLRGSQVVYNGTLDSLKNQKKDVTEMRKGSECGMGFENWGEFEEGDQVQCYEEQKTARTL